MSLKQQVSKMMARAREGRLPSSEVIVRETFQELGYQLGIDSQKVRLEFNDRLRKAFDRTLDVLERYEDQAYGTALVDELFRMKPSSVQAAEKIVRESSDLSKGFRDAIRSLYVDWYTLLREVFLSISQSRKTRGGRDFELAFGTLLEYADIPYQKERRRTHTDFMVPSDDIFERYPNVALVLSAKRTLRERWREVAEELYDLRAPNVYLITADSSISQGHVDGICGQYRIHLVVWDEIKKTTFPDEPRVLGFTQLASEVVPLYEDRWPKQKGLFDSR